MKADNKKIEQHLEMYKVFVATIDSNSQQRTRTSLAYYAGVAGVFIFEETDKFILNNNILLSTLILSVIVCFKSIIIEMLQKRNFK